MEKERLIYSISRFDHYFDSVNNKTAVYIAINTFVVGSLITLYITLVKEIICYSEAFQSLIAISFLLGLITLIILVNASIPFFSKDSESMYYFGGIGTMKKEDFISCSKNLTIKEELKDLRNQVHTLSSGLTTKFTKLKLAGRLLIIQFVLLIPIFIIIIFNK
ncbi:hypothetical protein [Cellulophaga tyrosinoxydans]|uniref:Pycsar effector protein domain-containing protein n=1 Tax=Cellulophaga tyrosinoxydans TaxID=504486 RepID=A0A1W2BIU7_9FLAO|nr:hypothetical protein [Cellulophaga tyrosinoxydans]SMC72690.1 hypothetical protein SAMN05660703_2429 [Cellulophaga tyrosinoxydans]